NTELFKNKDNYIKNAQTNKKLANLGEITKKMAAGESGIGEYKYNGVNKVVTYAPIKKSDGWSIGVNVEKNEFLKAIITAMITVIILSIIIIIAGIAFGGYTAFKIGQRITSCAKRLQLLSQGDISTPVPQTHSKDETKILVDATTETVLRLQMVVTDITYILGEMAKKNFNVKLEQEYAGDFVPVHSAMNEILKSLNSVMSQINQSSSQVSSGADQVASGAQGLSQGATEQASSVQELSASIVDISSQVKDNAQNSS
ncbi:MAG: methyl-accepting chemotaxis protein, partial [Clostridia bacterium]